MNHKDVIAMLHEINNEAPVVKEEAKKVAIHAIKGSAAQMRAAEREWVRDIKAATPVVDECDFFVCNTDRIIN